MQSGSGLGRASFRIEPSPGPKIALGDTSQSNPSDDNRTRATFHFSDPSVAEAGLSSAQQAAFRAAFDRGFATLEMWCREMGWQPSSTPTLQVFVSTRYRISRALVPAWEGRAGRMEFPTARVTIGQAAITHELVHILLPNGNRLLAEGLAIYLQALIGGNPAFPNFGQPLHAVAQCALREMVQMPFDAADSRPCVSPTSSVSAPRIRSRCVSGRHSTARILMGSADFMRWRVHSSSF